MPLAGGWGPQPDVFAHGAPPRGGFGSVNDPKYGGAGPPKQPVTGRWSPQSYAGGGGYGAPVDPNALYNSYNALSGPQYAGLANSDAQLRARRGLLGQQLGVGQGQAQLGYDEGLFNLNQARGANTIDLAAAYRLAPHYDKLMDFARLNLEQEMKGFGFDESNTRVSSAQEKANYKSDVAGRGATYAPGTAQQFGTIQSLLTGNLGKIDVGRHQAYISTGKELAQLEESKKQGQDSAAKLQQVADSFGTRADFLKRDLTLGLKQLGIGHQISVNDIMGALTSNDIKRKEIGLQAMLMAQQAAAAQRGAYSGARR